jgi:hypothetical protein
VTVRIAIDLNVRFSGNQTYAGFEDVDPPGCVLFPGQEVTVFERETGIEAPATVASLVYATALVYLDVAWDQFREPAEAEDDPACELPLSRMRQPRPGKDPARGRRR